MPNSLITKIDSLCSLDSTTLEKWWDFAESRVHYPKSDKKFWPTVVKVFKFKIRKEAPACYSKLMSSGWKEAQAMGLSERRDLILQTVGIEDVLGTDSLYDDLFPGKREARNVTVLSQIEAANQIINSLKFPGIAVINKDHDFAVKSEIKLPESTWDKLNKALFKIGIVYFNHAKNDPTVSIYVV